MPGYAGAGKATILRTNGVGILFSFQDGIISAPQLSVAFLLERISHSYYPWGLSWELTFSANPGNFEVDLVAANTDIATSYISLGSITQASTSGVVSGAYTYRYDMASNIWPKYVAGYLKSLANSVNTSLVVTR
jgi:hypothetical protein